MTAHLQERTLSHLQLEASSKIIFSSEFKEPVHALNIPITSPIDIYNTMKENNQTKRQNSSQRTLQSSQHYEQSSDAAHEAVFYKTNDFVGVVHVIMASLLRSELEWPGFTFDEIGFTWWELRAGIGLIFLLAGVWILRSSYSELERFSQPFEPGKPTTKLVTTGPFALSRHPAYTANLLLIAPGFGLLCNDLWVLVCIPMSAIVFYFLLVAPEEAYLKARFGKAWEDYCTGTRRWL